jgi:type 1 glutamine amidotransferase
MLTATAGFRHDSIATARQVMSQLAASSGQFTVTATEDLSAISAANLAAYDVVFFALTSGELAFTDAQKSALLAFVAGGGGFMGAHSATDTLYNWADYGPLVGAYFKEHPWTRDATVIVEDGSHPASQNLGLSFSLMEEFYTFRENPRPRVQVLLRLDAGSVARQATTCWRGRIPMAADAYTTRSVISSTWNDARFKQQLQAPSAGPAR